MKKPQPITLLAGAIFLVGGFVATLPATSAPPSEVVLEAKELTESSGVCEGENGILWSHNDSGGKPTLYGFAPSGELRVRLTIEGATAIDWEDVCSFRIDKDTYLAVADVGDNLARRKHVEIYIVREPKSPKDATTRKVVDLTAPLVGKFTVTYASGPVNCESIAYDPVRQAFLLPSKETTRCRLFEVDAKRIHGNISLSAKSIASMFLPLATGADISQDGKLLVLCSYGPGCLLGRSAGSDAWDTKSPKIFKLPNRRQGEAICFSRDGKQLYLTSEFPPTPLLTIDCPQ